MSLCSINFSIHWARSELRGCPRRPVPRLATFWGAGKSRRARAPSAANARIWARKQVICGALEFARTYFGSAETTPEAAQLNTRHRESSSLRWLFILFVKILARGSSYFPIESLIFSTAIEVPHEIRLLSCEGMGSSLRMSEGTEWYWEQSTTAVLWNICIACT